MHLTELFASGNSECVAVINNYVPKEDVYYYTRKQPLEKEPKLPVELAKPIHKLVMSVRNFISMLRVDRDLFYFILYR